MFQSIFRRFVGLLLLAILIVPLGIAPTRAAAQPDDPGLTQLPAIPPVAESEPNDTISNVPALDQADSIGSAVQSDYTQLVTGAISSASDIDYYKLVLTQPASTLKIRLSNLSADYDLVLLTGPDTGIEEGQSGLDELADIGGSISSIGGSISSIGGSISSIGGSISSIGGSISSIGGSISSISANPGTADEAIDSFLWLPGTYYIAVGPSNGEVGGSSYVLDVELDGSGLTKPGAAPDVRMNETRQNATWAGGGRVTTLYIWNSLRMSQLYGSGDVSAISSQLTSLATNGRDFGAGLEYGYVIDLNNMRAVGGRGLADYYNDWTNNPANPLYANVLAGIIRHLIVAATDPLRGGVSGANVGFELGSGTPTLPPGQAPFPDVKNIVLVGGDNMLPLYRLPDLTTVANESDYAAYLRSIDTAGVIDPNKPQGAALKYRMLLSDNPFGTFKPYRFLGFPFFVPDLAVGRLVETPTDIRRYLTRWAYTGSYTIEARTSTENGDAFVTGYDFLKDEAETVSKTLALAGFVPQLPTSGSTPGLQALNNDSWTRNDLETAWFGGEINSGGGFQDITTNPAFSHRFQLYALNSHFDHWQLLPATGASAANGTYLARRLYTPDYLSAAPGGHFYGTLGYSVGCHSGYSVITDTIKINSRLLDPFTYQIDFAQAINRQAGNWIGNTGYGYGTADGIDYSERLAVLLTQELSRDMRGTVTSNYIGRPIGEALRNAKERYVRNSTILGVYDVKAVSVMTFYGLPWIRLLVSAPLTPPAEEIRLGPGGVALPTPGDTKAPLPTPGAGQLGQLERYITVTIDLDNNKDGQIDTRTLPRTGSQEIDLSESDFTVEDSFVDIPGSTFPRPQLRFYTNNQAGRPTLPAFAYDISALSASSPGSDSIVDRLEVRDVVFRGGDYGALAGFNPQITQIVTETDEPIVNTATEPNFAAGAGVWYPDKFFGYSSVGQGDEQRDQLVSAVAQFRANDNGVTGLMRPYKKLYFKILYTDPNASDAQTGLTDQQPPQIESVRMLAPGSANLAAATVKVVATIKQGLGGTGIDEVNALYLTGGTSWQMASFTQTGPNSYTADIPTNDGKVLFIVSATDKAGNTAYYTGKGSFNLKDKQIFLSLLR